MGDAVAKELTRDDELGQPARRAASGGLRGGRVGPRVFAPGAVLMHAATEAVLRYFEYEHLPEHLQAVSRPFHELAHKLAAGLDGPEVTVGLRKLLEAKDCMVRAALPDPRV